jgi:hypothetical protein
MDGKTAAWQGGKRWVALILCVACAPTLPADPPSFFSMFGRRVAADPNQAYELTEAAGPWMILAASFGGEEGEAQARELVLELRKDFNLPAYLHRRDFDYSQRLEAKNTMIEGRPAMRYANASQYTAYTVLVGDFVSPNDPALQRTLDLIKHARPATLDYSKRKTTAQRFAALREWQRQVLGDEKKKKQGPMRTAFATRNPLLPEEYFGQDPVDAFVEEMNRDLEFSLLKSKGKFTICVRSFDGEETTDFGNGARASELKEDPDRLDRYALKAHEMTMELRRQGVEAYEYHNRFGSYVCVGSFDELGSMGSDGVFRYSGEALKIIETYRAGDQLERTAFGVGIRAKNVAGVPFDVQPRPMAIPRPASRGLFAGQLRAGS